MTMLFIWIPPWYRLQADSPSRKCLSHGVVPAVGQPVDDADHSIDCPDQPAEDLDVALPVNLSLERHDAVCDVYANRAIRGEHQRRDDVVDDLTMEVFVSAQEHLQHIPAADDSRDLAAVVDGHQLAHVALMHQAGRVRQAAVGADDRKS